MNTIARLAVREGKACRKPARTPREGASLRFSGLRFSAALLALLAVCSSPAASEPFQQFLNGECSPKLCSIDFDRVPAGSSLFVNNVSCHVVLTVTGKGPRGIRKAQLLTLDKEPQRVVNAITLVPRYEGDANGSADFALDHAVYAFAGAQQRYRVSMRVEADILSKVDCHISGNLMKG